MLRPSTVLRVAMCGTIFTALSFGANYNGIGYLVSNGLASQADPTSLTLAQVFNSGTVTFQATGLNFSSYGNIGNTGNPSAAFTVGTFLSSLGSQTGSAVYTGINANTALSGGGLGFLFDFTGTANFTPGSQFSVTHDDGVTLTVGSGPNSVILSSPGPSSPVNNTFTYMGPGGNQSFNFIYGECCTAPAVFETTLVPASTPEPTSIILFGTTLLGVGTLVRRKYRKA